MTGNQSRAVDLATLAYHAAVREDWPAASAAMAAAGRLDANTIALVLVAFCDTAIGLQPGTERMSPPGDGLAAAEEGPVRPGWVNAETGQVTLDADEMPPAVRWAGRLVAARAAMDLDGFQALLRAMPDNAVERGAYANALLRSVASLAVLAAKNGGAA